MEIESHIEAIIRKIDPTNNEIDKTPKRIAKSY